MKSDQKIGRDCTGERQQKKSTGKHIFVIPVVYNTEVYIHKFIITFFLIVILRFCMFLRGENVGESFLTTFRDKLNLFQGDCGSKHFCLT